MKLLEGMKSRGRACVSFAFEDLFPPRSLKGSSLPPLRDVAIIRTNLSSTFTGATRSDSFKPSASERRRRPCSSIEATVLAFITSTRPNGSRGRRKERRTAESEAVVFGGDLGRTKQNYSPDGKRKQEGLDKGLDWETKREKERREREEEGGGREVRGGGREEGRGGREEREGGREEGGGRRAAAGISSTFAHVRQVGSLVPGPHSHNTAGPPHW